MRRLITVLMSVLLIGGCEGPAGPEGPQGPQGPPGPVGPQGPAGVGTRLTFDGIFTSTAVDVELPAAAGSLADPPIVDVYIAESLGGPYLAVSDGFSSASTFFGLFGSPLEVRIRNGITGWYWWIVVVY